MSLEAQYRNWSISGNYGAAVTIVGSVGLFQYNLEGFDLVPETAPVGRPFSVPEPSMAPNYEWQQVPGGPVREATIQPRTITGVTNPRLRSRFGLLFGGAGGGPGSPVGASYSTPDHPSSTSYIHFIGPSRCARDFQGPALVIDGGINVFGSPVVVGAQLLIFRCPTDIVNGTAEFARRLNDALGDGEVHDPIQFISTMIPLTGTMAVAYTAGQGTGLSLGLTVYGGGFRVG